MALRHLLVLGTLLLGACDLRNAFMVKDSEGTTYRVGCVRDRCPIEVETPFPPAPGAACRDGEHPAVVLTGKRVVTVCHACVSSTGGVIDPGVCRVLTCTAPTDCPPFRGQTPTTCVNGLCQVAVEKDLDTVSAGALCMIGAGPIERGAPRQRDARLALAARACDASGICRAPQGCREP